jgi:hypothetical protein
MEAAFLTTEFLTEWGDLLRGVSSGPWRSSGSIVAHEDPDVTSEIAATRTLPDAQHFARCDPRTIGALRFAWRVHDRFRIVDSEAFFVARAFATKGELGDAYSPIVNVRTRA